MPVNMEKLPPLLFSIKQKYGAKIYQNVTERTHSPYRSAHEEVRMKNDIIKRTLGI
jgi:hypothetical protein